MTIFLATGGMSIFKETVRMGNKVVLKAACGVKGLFKVGVKSAVISESTKKGLKLATKLVIV
jgi:hypothetical protein